MSNADTGDCSVWLSPSTSHSGLQSICTSARQHLVDSDDVVRVHTDTHVERVLSGGLGHIFVGADTGGFEGFGRDLFELVGYQVCAEGELVYRGLLLAQVDWERV